MLQINLNRCYRARYNSDWFHCNELKDMIAYKTQWARRQLESRTIGCRDPWSRNACDVSQLVCQSRVAKRSLHNFKWDHLWNNIDQKKMRVYWWLWGWPAERNHLANDFDIKSLHGWSYEHIIVQCGTDCDSYRAGSRFCWIGWHQGEDIARNGQQRVGCWRYCVSSCAAKCKTISIAIGWTCRVPRKHCLQSCRHTDICLHIGDYWVETHRCRVAGVKNRNLETEISAHVDPSWYF